jgi:hypothetical protein
MRGSGATTVEARVVRKNFFSVDEARRGCAGHSARCSVDKDWTSGILQRLSQAISVGSFEPP